MGRGVRRELLPDRRGLTCRRFAGIGGRHDHRHPVHPLRGAVDLRPGGAHAPGGGEEEAEREAEGEEEPEVMAAVG